MSDDPADYRSFNATVALDGRGRIMVRQHKFHLVSFSEYIPLSEWLPIETIAKRAVATPGPGPGFAPGRALAP